MKTETLLSVVALSVLAFVAFRVSRSALPGQRANVTGDMRKYPATYADGYPSLIAYAAQPGDAAWGWQYFTDGVAIGPDGSYYKNDALVWSPQR